MTDFDLSEEHKMLQEMVYKFAVNELGPIIEEMDEKDELDPTVFPKLAQMGLPGINVSEEYGGTGSDILSAVLVMEALSRIAPAVALSYGAHTNLCLGNIYNNANLEQKKRYVPDLCSAKLIGAMALTEPGAGSDAVGIATVARKEGEKYFLSGSKTFITNAPIADLFVLYAKTDKSAGPRGISAFIIEKDFPGFSVSKKIKKIGHRGSPTGELFLDECEVPSKNLLGKENDGIRVMMNGLDIERVFFSGTALGTAQGAFDLALKYSKQREQFGKPISSFQLIQAKLADMYAKIEATRWLCYRAATLAEKIQRGGKGTEIHKVAAAAIYFAGRVGKDVVDEAVQIHGGYGYTLEYPVNRFYRDAKLSEIGGGTQEIRSLIIAQELLK